MLSDTYSALVADTSDAAADPLVIELVFNDPLPPDGVSARISAALPEVAFDVSAVFDETADRFHFARFPAATSVRREADAFQFARELRGATEAAEANPVLTDSLYGAIAAGATDQESFGSFCETPRDDGLPWGWVHPRLKTTRAWTKTRGAGTKVAVIDTGHSTHNELSGAIAGQGQLNLVEGGTDASDRFSTGFMKHPGHGTLVCSVVASRGDADENGNVPPGSGGVTGAAPEATILPIRAIRSVINFTQETVPPAIRYAADNGAGVIAMALGGPTRVSATEAALRYAVSQGVVIVCAAGNCWPSVVFPAAYAAEGICTAVAALNPDLTPWARTGSGPEVTFSCFGVNVWGAAKNKASDPDHGIRPAQGTTLATSLTAGSAALWVAHHGGRDALRQKAAAAGTTVQAMFVHCATQGLTPPPVWGGSRKLGAGLLDVEKLLDTPLPDGTEAPPPADIPGPGVVSSLAVLETHLANHAPEALADVDAGLADYASEMLWLRMRAGARARAAAIVETESMLARPDRASATLDTALEGKPALRNALGVN